MTSVSSNSFSQEPWLDKPVVLILCGLVASGKSTFAEQLQQHFPKFRRCNQDDLGDRRKVERLARESLAQGLSVCIDRTNVNAEQRNHWIRIAREFPGTSIWVMVFNTPYEVCEARLRTRVSHPTIKSPEQGLWVLSNFAADFVYPEPSEGYDNIISLQPADHMSPVYTRTDVAAILQRVHDSPVPVSTLSFPQPHASQSFQAWQYTSVSTRRGHLRGRYPYSRGRGLPTGRGYNPANQGALTFRPHSVSQQSRGRSSMPNGSNPGFRPKREAAETPTSTRVLIKPSVASSVDGRGTRQDPYII